MRTTYRLGTLFGLRVSAHWSAIIASLILWSLLTEAFMLWLGKPLAVALVAGLVAVLLHWLGALGHQLGHAWAARRTGYPMLGIRAWGPLEGSIYPKDEPELPAAVHIRRALGGPLGGLAVSLIAGVGLLIVSLLAHHPHDNIVWWVALFFALDAVLVFTLGAFLPLGFTDGSTLLHWRGKR